MAHPKKRAFLAALSQLGNRTADCKAAKVPWRTYSNWRQDPEFKAAVRAAIDEACDVLELEAFRRAHDGVLEPVYQGGKKVGMMRRYSDTLLIFLLKAANPARYRETYRAEITEAGGKPFAAAPLAEILTVLASGLIHISGGNGTSGPGHAPAEPL